MTGRQRAENVNTYAFCGDYIYRNVLGLPFLSKQTKSSSSALIMYREVEVDSWKFIQNICVDIQSNFLLLGTNRVKYFDQLQEESSSLLVLGAIKKGKPD